MTDLPAEVPTLEELAQRVEQLERLVLPEPTTPEPEPVEQPLTGGSPPSVVPAGFDIDALRERLSSGAGTRPATPLPPRARKA